MNYDVVLIIVFFIIFISIQYSLNKILVELKNIRKILTRININENNSK